MLIFAVVLANNNAKRLSCRAAVLRQEALDFFCLKGFSRGFTLAAAGAAAAGANLNAAGLAAAVTGVVHAVFYMTANARNFVFIHCIHPFNCCRQWAFARRAVYGGPAGFAGFAVTVV